MRSNTLKWIVLSATLLAAIIVTVQLYWLVKVYSLEQRSFHTNVVKSIRSLFEDLQMNDAPGTHLESLIDAPGKDEDYFVFKADTIPIKDSLIFYIQDEFADFGVLTDCKLGAWSSTEKRYVYDAYIPAPASHYPNTQAATWELPVFKDSYDNIVLYFPHRHEYILGEMDFWIVSTVILFIALIGLGASLFYFYRQKFLAEIQKDFVNNFTHEFKTPLAVMKIASDVLAQDSIARQPDRLERYAAIIQNQTEHLQNQVERLLRTASTLNWVPGPTIIRFFVLTTNIDPGTTLTSNIPSPSRATIRLPYPNPAPSTIVVPLLSLIRLLSGRNTHCASPVLLIYRVLSPSRIAGPRP